MRDPEIDTTSKRTRHKPDVVVAGNDIAHHNGDASAAGRDGIDAAIGVVGSLAIDDGDCGPPLEPSMMIPSELLFVMTLLSMPGMFPDPTPVGAIRIPEPRLLEAIVFDTEKLLKKSVLVGEIKIPALVKPRVTQFSIARSPLPLNRMPFVPVPSPSMVRPRRWMLSPALALIVMHCPRGS
ncbi:MAG: hypothetical protein ACR2KT_06555 [Methylocella sp.]